MPDAECHTGDRKNSWNGKKKGQHHNLNETLNYNWIDVDTETFEDPLQVDESIDNVIVREPMNLVLVITILCGLFLILMILWGSVCYRQYVID